MGISRNFAQFEKHHRRIHEDRPWEIEVGKMSRTEMLSRWIHHMRSKKVVHFRQNVRVQAILAHAVNKAENELRAKQLLRIRRWKQVRRQLLKGIEYGNCGAFNMAEHERNKQLLAINVRNAGGWRKGELCKDLRSLDNFLLQLTSSRSLGSLAIQRC